MSLFKRKKKEDKKDQIEKSDKIKVEEKDKKEIKKSRALGSDKKKEVVKERKFHGQAYKHLIRPVISEKASGLGMYNQYIFEVAPKSNKVEIKKAIENLYGVKPIKINISNMRGKNVRRGRNVGRLRNWKKAIITLKQGDKIDVYEGV